MRTRPLAALLLAPLLAGHLACLPSSIGAGALLHPSRRPVPAPPALAHREVTLEGEGVTLRGWLFPAAGARRGVTVVYLHGVADNRASGTWIAEKLVPLGFDVLAYDGRAHGASGGSACTYGHRERRDLARALDGLGVRRAILVGVSLGAAVALQAAAEDPEDDPRIAGVVSAATFADLETLARERAPFFATEGQLSAALARAEREGRFRVAEASPVASAQRVRVPVLLLHGAADAETPPAHSRRVFDALAGPKTLRIVEGAGHDDALGKAWPEVERWIVAVGDAAARPAPPPGPR